MFQTSIKAYGKKPKLDVFWLELERIIISRKTSDLFLTCIKPHKATTKDT